MTHSASNLIERLTKLIAMPTHQRLDAGSVGDELACCELIASWLAPLGPDEIIVKDTPRGDGDLGAYVFARWGTPTLVINAHVDTVPPNKGWSRPPWTPHVDGERVWGLGACDTKGAIACALEAIVAMPLAARRNFGVLFSGDEENHTAVMQAFLASSHARGIRNVIVCEPTERQAGISHRGIIGYRDRANGPGGHSSLADTTAAPLLILAKLATALADGANTTASTAGCSNRNMCFNIGQMGGGVAFNVIPQTGELVWSVRPPPGFSGDAWAREISAIYAEIAPHISHECFLDQPPFLAHDTAWIEPVLRQLNVPMMPVDFWTEAAWWAGADVNAVVIGPGSITAAHAPNESVQIADLQWFTSLLFSVLNAPR